MTQKKYTAASGRLRSGFTAVPNLVVRSDELSGDAKALYAIMLDLAWRGEEPELPALATLIRASEKPCRRAIKELEEVALITVKRRGQGLTNAYIIHEPETLQNGQFDRSRNAPEADLSSIEDKEQDAGAKAPAAGADLERPGRARNLVFDALVEATNANPAGGGMIGKAAKSIRTAMDDTLRDLRQGYLAQNPHEDEVPRDVIDELIAGQIRMRAELYRTLRPEWELTPTALAKHWNRIPTWAPNTGMRPSEIAKLRDEDFGVGG